MDLNGWDFVSVFSMAAANDALARASLGVMGVFAFSESEVQIAGRFGPWRLETGGSGSAVRLALPIAAGSVVGLGSGTAPGGGIALDGVTVHLEVTLELRQQGAALHSLVFGFGPGASQPSTTGGPKVSVVGVDDPAHRLTAFQCDEVGGYIEDGLNGHADEVGHVFAQIGQQAAAAMGWPAVVDSAFAYVETGSPAVGHLALFGSGGASSPGSPVVAPELIGSADLVLALAPGVVLRAQVLPMMPSIVGHGTAPANFAFDPGRLAITMTGSLALDSTRVGLVNYYPVITALSLSIEGSQLVTQLTGTCDLYAGTMTWHLTIRDGLVFDAATATMRFARQGDPTSSHEVSGGGGVLVPGLAWIIGLIITYITKTVDESIADTISSGLAAGLAGLHLDQTAAIPIRWTGADHTRLAGARLDDALVATLVRTNG